MDDKFEHLFAGKKQMFRALRDAGKRHAKPLRNVPWVNFADDGGAIVNVWRHSLGQRGGLVYSDFARKDYRPRNRIRRAKRKELMDVLTKSDGATVRVMLLDERVPRSGLTNGCKFDTSRWLVHNLGDRFELRRGRKGKNKSSDVPVVPEAFGVLNPKKRQRVSEIIERLSYVKRATLARAQYQCEIPGCKDQDQFRRPDVHHITRLGDSGSDHTDNTVAVCPACHARIHRGKSAVSERIDRIVESIRYNRLSGQATRS
jgi:hypothetical protein